MDHNEAEWLKQRIEFLESQLKMIQDVSKPQPQPESNTTGHDEHPLD